MYPHVLLLACSISWQPSESKLTLPRSRGVARDPSCVSDHHLVPCIPYGVAFASVESRHLSVTRRNDSERYLSVALDSVFVFDICRELQIKSLSIGQDT